MDAWFSVLLGVVQGVTEFLPISSTAHLRITPALLGVADPGAAYSAVIQLGTLVAVVAYFARDLGRMTVAVVRDPKSPDGRLPWLLVVGTVPIVVFGLLLKDFITGPFRSLWVVGGALIAVGVIMAIVDSRRPRERLVSSLGFLDASLIGFAQAAALIPGVSRSGATIIAALALGLGRPDAARFSFLLGIPAIAGAGIYEIPEALGSGADWGALVIGTVAAAISGYMAIAWLLHYLGRKSLGIFASYRVLAGLLVLALCALEILDP